jgi:hypothetical protein
MISGRKLMLTSAMYKALFHIPVMRSVRSNGLI